jgi:transcriptional regulator with GAF, ATPase, and Fis domain
MTSTRARNLRNDYFEGEKDGDAPISQAPQTRRLTEPPCASRESFVLRVHDGQGATSIWASRGPRTTIGSLPSNDVALTDRAVSRIHCAIERVGNGFAVRDLDSLNGTFVDGVRVREAFLCHGTRVRIGQTVLEFSLQSDGGVLPLSPRSRLGTLAGVSAAMRAAFAILERAAERDVTVLIEGETGTGKTQAARAIHANSPRKDGPFVVVDCGAMVGSLLESELFGHEKGAFTGALSRRIGAFEEAHGGTIFLDEVGELPLDLQPKLLRALEARTFRRLGSNQHVGVDVRVIAATNRDLRADLLAGRFREDLYFRLGVVTVELPSLRKRPEDFPILVDDLLESLGATAQEKSRLGAPEFVLRLSRAAWPGNVRELRNFLERCLVLGQALDTEEFRLGDAVSELHPSHPPGAPYSVARELAMARFERHFFEKLLETCDGRVADVARTCRLDRRYVYRILKRHGLRADSH